MNGQSRLSRTCRHSLTILELAELEAVFGLVNIPSSSPLRAICMPLFKKVLESVPTLQIMTCSTSFCSDTTEHYKTDDLHMSQPGPVISVGLI